MSIHGEGVIEIALEDFWEFVAKHHPKFQEVAYGVPRVNKNNDTIEIDVAFGSITHLSEWAVKPEAVKQWEEE